MSTDAALLQERIDALEPDMCVCRDESCPRCGYPETGTAATWADNAINPLAVYCRRCGWFVVVDQ